MRLADLRNNDEVFVVYNPTPVFPQKTFKAVLTNVGSRWGGTFAKVIGAPDYAKEWFNLNTGFARGWNTLFLMTPKEIARKGGPINLQEPIP